MSVKGSPYANFTRALQTRKLSVVLAAAAELQAIQLDDALEILILMAQEQDPRFDRAATRWAGLLLAETPIGLADARRAGGRPIASRHDRSADPALAPSG